MVTIINILSSEVYKTRRTWNFTLTILLPVLITVLVFGYALKDALKEGTSGGSNPWLDYSRAILQFYFLLYPLLASVISFSMSSIEHRNNGFRQIFTLPVSKRNIYFSKIAILLFWMAVSLMLAYALLILSGNIMGMLFPQMGFQNYDLQRIFFTFFMKVFISLTAIIAIHFFLSMYWNNFVVSVGSACFLVMFGLVVVNWKHSYLIPYCNFLKAWNSVGNLSTVVFTREVFWSIGYAVLFFTGGFYIMKGKSIR